MMRQFLFAVAAVAIAVPAHAEDKACRAEIGAAKAQQLVDQCVNISPATHPPCNADNPCALIRDEIARGCALAREGGGSDVPDYCADYPEQASQPSGY